MSTNSIFGIRHIRNLRSIRRVRLTIAIDLQEQLEDTVERVRRDVAFAARETLEASGLDVSDESDIPELRIGVSVRIVPNVILNTLVIGYRIESTVRENVALRFGETDPEKAVAADTWRHQAEFNFVSIAQAQDTSTAEALDEVKQQLKTFLLDWGLANPGSSSGENEADNLSLQISEIGTVFEHRLRDYGIRTIIELANLSDPEIVVMSKDFAGLDPAGLPDVDKGAALLRSFRKKAKAIVAN